MRARRGRSQAPSRGEPTRMLTRLSSPTERIRRKAARSTSPKLPGALDENRIPSGGEEASARSIGRMCGRTDFSDGWEKRIKRFKQFDEGTLSDSAWASTRRLEGR